jgi:hypothetical protein
MDSAQSQGTRSFPSIGSVERLGRSLSSLLRTPASTLRIEVSRDGFLPIQDREAAECLEYPTISNRQRPLWLASELSCKMNGRT